MFELLEGYLDAFTTPEMGSLILNSTKLLYDQGIESHVFQVQEAIYEAERGDEGSGMDSIPNLVEATVASAMRQMGVWVSEDSGLRDIYPIYRALTMIENYEDRESISIALDSEGDNVEVLADILHVVDGLSPELSLPHLELVRPELLVRIRDLVPGLESVEPINPIVAATVQGRLRRFVELNPITKDSVFSVALEDGLRLGTSFEILMDRHLSEILTKPAKQCSKELVLFALASPLPVEEIEDKLKNVRQSATYSVIELMEIDRDIREYLKGVSHV